MAKTLKNLFQSKPLYGSAVCFLDFQVVGAPKIFYILLIFSFKVVWVLPSTGSISNKSTKFTIFYI